MRTTVSASMVRHKGQRCETIWPVVGPFVQPARLVFDRYATCSAVRDPTSVRVTMNGQSAPSVRLQGVTKRFGDFTAVDSLNLDIERGEFFTLLGPSGCGKTTTLRMIAGFEDPTEGRVLLDGDEVTDQ